jgi:hypothetical protein
MDRTEITTSVGFLVAIFKFVPVVLLIGSAIALFVIPQKTVGAGVLVVSLAIGGLFYFLAKRLGDIANLEYDERTLYVEAPSGSYQTPLDQIQSIEQTDTRLSNQYLWRVTFEPGQPLTFQFCPLETLWNHSFRDFLTHLKTVNPEAIKSAF